MTDYAQRFMFNALIVILSALLSFLVQYISDIQAGLETSAVAGGLGFLGTRLRDSIFRV
jgi:hypothetical protein